VAATPITIESLWQEYGFEPNPAQREAILHVSGPLYLPAGPGSGKTRVLLWRTLNLLVFQNVAPEQIYLSTFTEKAATQLKEGLQALLGIVTNRTGRSFDLANMYVGTVHSLCQRLLRDRRFTPGRLRPRAPRLLDDLEQYFFLYRRRTWRDLLATVGLDIDEEGSLEVNSVFGGNYDSRHEAATQCIRFFNRLSEEHVNFDKALDMLAADNGDLETYLTAHDLTREGLRLLLQLYGNYRQFLTKRDAVPLTDFSLVQQEAYQLIANHEQAGSVFKHLIIDEYQDTNTIQERLFFKLAEGSGNICVVGDDDQALYRFRGATVENFVEFPQRCKQYLGITPTRIPLSINYRSCPPIVRYYRKFIERCDWSKENGQGHYRVVDKDIRAHRKESGSAVVTTTPSHPDECFAEIADLIVELLRKGKVTDPNQVAFLFPSLKSTQAKRAMDALEKRGLKVYAPRAGKFLQVPEATDMLGILARILGATGMGRYTLGGRGNWNEYRTWLHNAKKRADELAGKDDVLASYIRDRQEEIAIAIADHEALQEVVQQRSWDPQAPYDIERMKRTLIGARGLSQRAQSRLSYKRLDDAVRRHQEQGRPDSLRYVIRRATSLDWSVLDVFYHLCGMRHFRAMFDLAERGEDEAPICNLALISQYLRRFMDQYGPILTADLLQDGIAGRLLFASYCYALWRLGESEYENAEDPFPRGRIPFLTIHQSKGLEFPVVVLGNPYKRNQGPQLVEKMVRPFLQREAGEPLDRIAEFDIMRMFYVALSRAENLLVIPQFQGRGQRVSPMFRELFAELPAIADLDTGLVPVAQGVEHDMPRPYSYTSDYLAYRRCPRQYMIYRKYGFASSRTQTVFFGSLVHRTLDDLHNYLIARKAGPV